MNKSSLTELRNAHDRLHRWDIPHNCLEFDREIKELERKEIAEIDSQLRTIIKDISLE